MASMQICKPACEGTYKETEKVKYISRTQGYNSIEHKHHEHTSSSYSVTKVGHHAGGMQCMKHPGQNCNCSQGGNVSEHKHHEHKQSGCALNQGGMHYMKHPGQNSNCSPGGYVSDHKHHEHKQTGCATNQGGHHVGDMIHEHPGHHRGLTEKISGLFRHNSSHQGHHTSYGYTEKIKEHNSRKSGHVKSKMHIKQETSWKGNRTDGSNGSDNERNNEGCKKKC